MKHKHELLIAKKRRKEYSPPSPKKLKKIKEQQLLYDLAKEVFRRNLKAVDVQTRHRKKENLFKIKIKGFEALAEIGRFQEKIKNSIAVNYKFSFCGSINPKTGREDILVYVTIFSQEGNYEATPPVAACRRSENERFTGVFGQTEIRSHT